MLPLRAYGELLADGKNILKKYVRRKATVRLMKKNLIALQRWLQNENQEGEEVERRQMFQKTSLIFILLQNLNRNIL